VDRVGIPRLQAGEDVNSGRSCTTDDDDDEQGVGHHAEIRSASAMRWASVSCDARVVSASMQN
jgi:hypothetical protein